MNKYQESVERLKSVQVTEGDTLGDLEVWEYIDEDLNPQEFNVVETFDCLQELIDKQEKYRWHDLRKDPNDLPKLRTKVLFAIVYFKELIGYGTADFTEKGFEDGINPPSLIKKFAIAWKYIEEFADE